MGGARPLSRKGGGGMKYSFAESLPWSVLAYVHLLNVD